ncbi:tetratricopeptide repeat protein [Dyella psychrodurans]|uniref:Tetratricopeptide repeat protein n=1 Tax=Dyella psychrodurans TaxID=1927960 RepID=A0A370XA39_9GAMM|nr:tetratricopeptide repeat protein [Dyella psychrodurans]RDS85303.1 tetratricopeptide repeat protein [Dyella psychrodurans]
MKIRSGTIDSTAFMVALAALLLVAWLAYRPGIDGAFLLDDFPNLSVLGTNGPVAHWDAFWRYVTSGSADPTGRPLALMSFLIDASDWPAPASPFKYTNILLHLLNGVLLCWAMLKIGKRRGLRENQAATMALIGSGIWLLQPLFVSTTLYVIQREAMLPATFTFISIICWCSARNAFDVGKRTQAITGMMAAAWFCTLVAALAKPNGMLLPLLLAAAEATVLRDSDAAAKPDQRARRVSTTILLGLPIALLAVYLVQAWPVAVRIASTDRPWSVGQRLLSEPRVLASYLRMLWIPQMNSTGVFYDQIQASSDLLHPWTTLPSIIFISCLVVFGWLARQRFPWLAFAILFYFAGQLLESSFFPLELAFEHRNYLPAAFMFVPVGFWFTTPRAQSLPWRAAAVALLCLLAGMTWMYASVWGNLRLQARLWGRINPDSPQAQVFAAEVEAASEGLPKAIKTLRASAMRMPNQPEVALTLVDLQCRSGSVDPQSWQLAIHSLYLASTGWNNIANWLITSIPNATGERCQGLTISALQQALDAAESNPALTRSHGHDDAFERASAALHLANGQPQQAAAQFDALLADSPSESTAFEQAQALNAAGHPELALEVLNRFAALPNHADQGINMARLHAWVLRKQGFWRNRLYALHQSLELAVKVKTGKASDGRPLDIQSGSLHPVSPYQGISDPSTP